MEKLEFIGELNGTPVYSVGENSDHFCFLKNCIIKRLRPFHRELIKSELHLPPLPSILESSTPA